MLKKVYSAQIIYQVECSKKSWWGKETQYEGDVFVPVQTYILATSKENAEKMVVYLYMRDESFLNEFMLKEYGVKIFDIKNKSIEIFDVEEDNIVELMLNMTGLDFIEWLKQKVQDA